MRRIPAHIDNKLRSTRQTKAANADPSLDLWISRPTTPLVDETFLERQTVPVTGGGITRTDIAVAHPVTGKGNSRIHVAFVQNGTAKVVTAAHKTKMSEHQWFNAGFSEPASDVAIAYDGTMPKATSGYEEFKTDREPWVFWVDDGALYARHLNANEPDVILADTNCTAVTAVRAMWSEVGRFDFGLVVFFLLSGSIYYRQLIGGEWTDAVPVMFGPAVTYVDIAASRTWDYRVALQAKTTSGTVYELFTQFEGVAKQNTEHIFADVNADADLIALEFINTREQEHISVAADADAALIYGLSSVPVSAENIDNGEGDWGQIVVLKLDYPVTNATGAADWFTLTANGMIYGCVSAVLSADGVTFTLQFENFNAAEGYETNLIYTAPESGGLQSPAVPMDSFTFAFNPENLVAPEASAPRPVLIWNE